MKAILSVPHPEVARLFEIVTALNSLLASSLGDFLHGDRDPICDDEKEIVWSIRSEHEPSYYKDDPEKMIIDITVSICKRSQAVRFRAGNIGGNYHEEVMTVVSHYDFKMTHRNNQWLIQIGFDGKSHNFSVPDAAAYIRKELLKE